MAPMTGSAAAEPCSAWRAPHEPQNGLPERLALHCRQSVMCAACHPLVTTAERSRGRRSRRAERRRELPRKSILEDAVTLLAAIVAVAVLRRPALAEANRVERVETGRACAVCGSHVVDRRRGRRDRSGCAERPLRDPA